MAPSDDDRPVELDELSLYRQFFEKAELAFGVAIGERIGLVNPALARMHGYDGPDELVGQPISILKANPDSLPRLIRQTEDEGRLVCEDVHRRKDGSTFPAHLSIAAVSSESGEPLYRTIIIDDLSERKRTERRERRLQQQLLSAQKMESIGKLAGGVAHDFNNLLAAVLITAQSALRGVESPRLRSAFETIEQAAQRGENLTRQLLTYAGQGTPEFRPVDLSQEVRELGELLDSSLTERVQVEYFLAEDLYAVRGDPTQIRQVIMNLMVNAADAMEGRSGALQVRTYHTRGPVSPPERAVLRGTVLEGDSVCVEVADAGCGMERDTIDNMFEPFTTTKGPGRGLGLSSVIGIVNAHEAQIMVESIAGVGTTVTVMFPADGRLRARAPREPSEARTPWVQDGVALVADDDPLVLGAMCDVLETAGMTVITAVDGHEAVAQFDQNRDRIDVVLLDVTMPGLDGIRALRQLHERGCTAPVILASGFADRVTVPKGLGCSDFISKPFEVEDLLATVQRLVSQTRDS